VTKETKKSLERFVAQEVEVTGKEPLTEREKKTAQQLRDRDLKENLNKNK